MKEIIELATSFINEHWEDISIRLREDVLKGSKEKALTSLKKDYTIASWIVCECMNWGCNTNYLKHYKVEAESDRTVFMIKAKYFMYDRASDSLKEVFPKTKQVLYFE